MLTIKHSHNCSSIYINNNLVDVEPNGKTKTISETPEFCGKRCSKPNFYVVPTNPIAIGVPKEATSTC